MSRLGQPYLAVLLSLLTLLSGCAPSRTFYFFEDGDLSHYKGEAATIRFPDTDSEPLPDVAGTMPPLTLRNIEQHQVNYWDLTLQEAVQTTLTNSKVIRLLRGDSTDGLLANPDGAPSVYDPALQQTTVGTGRLGAGPEAALSAFDAQFSTSMFWERNEQPRNVRFNPGVQSIFQREFEQDQGTFQSQISKTSRGGQQFAVRNNTIYDLNNNPTRDVASDFTTNFEVQVTQPLGQGQGHEFNGIAGPGFGPGNYAGVMIARINTDITLADFEGQVIDQVRQVEATYWNLYLTYRNLDAALTGRNSVLETWKKVKAEALEGREGGNPLDLARAEQEYLSFKAQVEQAWNQLHRTENQLRFLMGLSPTDGRLIRPIDEPTTARLEFDWHEIHCESLARHVNLRRQKWQIKKSELELIASKNFLLPRVDLVARYRWNGLGDHLIDRNGMGIQSQNPSIAGTDAFSTLTDGNYQEWGMGLQANIPIGFRRELTAVRNAQIRLTKDREVLRDQELSLTNLLTEAVRNMESNHVLLETSLSRGISSFDEVRAARVLLDAPTLDRIGRASILDLYLNAQRRFADAQREYYRVLVEYSQSIADVHLRKGSLLEYNSVYLAEGPWPGKAYFDAKNRARERDAGLFFNYGFTRPGVISRGPYLQHQGPMGPGMGPGIEQVPTPAGEPTKTETETLPEGGQPMPPQPMPPGRTTDQPPSDGPRLTSGESIVAPPSVRRARAQEGT